jgi:hypothetical protein
MTDSRQGASECMNDERTCTQSGAKLTHSCSGDVHGWQPFDTAPKVGAFLVYLPSELSRKYQVMYRTERTVIIGGAFAFDMSKPTLWMPLPEPPK